MVDGEWKAVEGATAAEKAAMRFFKVVVEGQEGRGSPRGLAPPQRARRRFSQGAPPGWRLSILLARTLVLDFMRKRMAIICEIVVYFKKPFSTEITLP